MIIFVYLKFECLSYFMIWAATIKITEGHQDHEHYIDPFTQPNLSPTKNGTAPNW
jgi:hypothetical protein